MSAGQITPRFISSAALLISKVLATGFANPVRLISSTSAQIHVGGKPVKPVWAGVIFLDPNLQPKTGANNNNLVEHELINEIHQSCGDVRNYVLQTNRNMVVSRNPCKNNTDLNMFCWYCWFLCDPAIVLIECVCWWVDLRPAWMISFCQECVISDPCSHLQIISATP